MDIWKKIVFTNTIISTQVNMNSQITRWLNNTSKIFQILYDVNKLLDSLCTNSSPNSLNKFTLKP